MLGKRTTRTPAKSVFEEPQLPQPLLALAYFQHPLVGPFGSSHTLGRLAKYLQVEADRAFPYQVWRGGLCLRSVVIQVQIDQHFSRSPYSTGHFPYCQLAESRGEETDKKKGS